MFHQRHISTVFVLGLMVSLYSNDFVVAQIYYGKSGYAGVTVYGNGSVYGIGAPISGGYYGIGSYPAGYAGGYYSSPYAYYAGNSMVYRNHVYNRDGYGHVYSHNNGWRQPVYVAPPSPFYGTTTTIIQGGQLGGVVEYTHNGNGYVYTPNSHYPAVVTQTPTLGLSRTNVVGQQPPVIIESRPSHSVPGNSRRTLTPTPIAGQIKISCPKSAHSPVNYTLNDHPYTIKPGYSQTFANDRVWTIEFHRGDEQSEVATMVLKSGNYTFTSSAKGWELLLPGETPSTSSQIPPAPIPEPPLPEEKP